MTRTLLRLVILSGGLNVQTNARHWSWFRQLFPADIVRESSSNAIRRFTASNSLMDERKNSELIAVETDAVPPACLEIATASLRDGLDIPQELAEAVAKCSSSRSWVRRLDGNPNFCQQRIEHLVEVVGITKQEIAEEAAALMNGNLYATAVAPSIFAKRERLHPFKSNAELMTRLFDISLETYYAAAATKLELLRVGENDAEKAKLLIHFGYPKDLLLKSWKKMRFLSTYRVKRRIETIERLEESSLVGFSRALFFESRHLLQDDAQFAAFLTKVAGQWRRGPLPPSILNRVRLFAELLGVTPELVVGYAEDSCNVCVAMFRNDVAIRKIVDIFAAVDVTGERMLQNCKFFEHREKDVIEAVETVRKLYLSDHFTSGHLAQVFSLLNARRLLVRSYQPGRRRKKGVWGKSGQRVVTRAALLDRGFSPATIKDCEKILDYRPDRVESVFEQESRYFSKETIAASSMINQVKYLNLLQYFVEKDLAVPVFID